MAAGSGLLKAKGIGATPGQVIAAPELSNDLQGDIKALKEFNNALKNGLTPAEAYTDHLTNVSKAAQDFARQSNGLPVDIDKYANAQTAASMATKVSTGSMIAQSVASAALSGAISMGVTLAVNGLVMGLDYLAHAQERAAEAAHNANTAYSQNQSELSSTQQRLTEIEERLHTLNQIEHKSLAEASETIELGKQRDELTEQINLLKARSAILKQDSKESAEDLQHKLESPWLSEYIPEPDDNFGKYYVRNSSSAMPTKSSKKAAEEWLEAIQSNSVDISDEKYNDTREKLREIADMYRQVGEGLTGADGEKARQMYEQLTFAIEGAAVKSSLFNSKLEQFKSLGIDESLIQMADAGKLTANNFEEIAGATLADQLNAISGSTEATVAQLKAMASSNESVIQTAQMMNEVESAVHSKRIFSIAQITELCTKYPELKDCIGQTAEGYYLEKSALDVLAVAVNNLGTSYIQAQITATEVALQESKKRRDAARNSPIIIDPYDPLKDGLFGSVSPSIQNPSGSPLLPSKLPNKTIYDDEVSAREKELAGYKKLLSSQQNIKNNYVEKPNQVGNRGGSGSQSYQNTALDNELKRIEHLKAIGKYENDELGYIKALENAKSKLTKKESERWQLEEKIYAAREAYEKQQLDDYLDEISYKEAMGKYDDNQAQKIADLTYAYNKLAKKKEDLRKLEQQIYKETKAYQEAEAKKAKDAADAIEDIVDMRMKYIRKEQELKKKALEDELDGYKKLYDAQAKALDKQKEADDYAKTAAKKRADIAEIETRLNELSADTSAASQREQAELRAELAEKQEDLEEYEKEQSIQRQKEKLDEEYALLEEQNNAKIEKIDEFLDNEGAVRDQAMADIQSRSSQVYQELIDWNQKYGDGIDKTVTDAWKAATDALEKYGTQANALKISENPDQIAVASKAPSASVQKKQPAAPSSNASSGGSKAPAKGGRASVTTKDAAAYASSSGKRVGSWSTMAKNAGVGWNQKLYVTNIANGKVAIGTTSKIGNTIAWVDKKNVKGYRTGSPFIPYDQLALVDEAGPELIIRNPVQGRLTHLSRGDGVLNSTLTERIMALAGNPAAFLSQSMAKLTSAFGAGVTAGAAPSIQIDSKVIVEGNADMETVKALEKAENRIAEKVFSQANKKYLRSGHTINPKHLA